MPTTTPIKLIQLRNDDGCFIWPGTASEFMKDGKIIYRLKFITMEAFNEMIISLNRVI